MKTRLRNIAVGTRDLPQINEKIVLSMGDYVETAIEYDSDIIVGQVLPKKAKLISRLGDLKNCEFLLQNHLKYLGRDKIDILLLTDPAVPAEDQEILPKYAEKLGLSGDNLKPEDLETWHKSFGDWPSYLSVPVNPQYYQKELLDFAKSHGVEIIGHEILGGPKKSHELLTVFGLQFLARFAAVNCDIIVMSAGANLEKEMILCRTLEDLLETDLTDGIDYELKKDVIVPDLGGPGSRRIHTYSEVSLAGKNHIFKNDSNEYISNNELVISTKGNLENIPTIDPDNLEESDKIYYETALVMNKIQNIEPPSRKEEVRAFYRYIAMAILSDCYGRTRYKFKTSRSGDAWRITIWDRLKFWKKANEYILYLSEQPGGTWEVFFRNL